MQTAALEKMILDISFNTENEPDALHFFYHRKSIIAILRKKYGLRIKEVFGNDVYIIGTDNRKLERAGRQLARKYDKNSTYPITAVLGRCIIFKGSYFFGDVRELASTKEPGFYHINKNPPTR